MQKIDIATGHSSKAKKWKNVQWRWDVFCEKLKNTTRTRETYVEYLAASKEDQAKIKDVGGYVGGYLRNGKRSPSNVVHRQLLTLDLDFAKIDFWDKFTLISGAEALLHSSHKHSTETPRYRLVLPLSRPVSADEYQAIGRKVAGELGINLFDPTTFEPNRLMYWPSTSSDGDWVYERQEGNWLDADKILDSYADWTDTSLWPVSQGHLKGINENVKRQQDPEEKAGIVGAFCRTYGVTEVLETFLSDQYALSAHEDRWTYVNGSTAAGLIVYDDKFAYSHHGTDPCSGKLCNAFDLARIHLYGHLDEGSEATGKNTPSYKEMEQLAIKDTRVKKTIAQERYEEAAYDFAQGAEDETEMPEEGDWVTELQVDGKGRYLPSATNFSLIFKHDPNLKDRFKKNIFDQHYYVFKSLPWRKIKRESRIDDIDYTGARSYIEQVYGIANERKVADALQLEMEKNTFHPVREYLEPLTWDGVPRLENLLPDYYGVEKTKYSTEALKTWMVGGVKRILEPGCKFELVLILAGKTGIGKSTLGAKLCGKWFSDSFNSVTGNESIEQMQGFWLLETPELSAIRGKVKREATKHFFAKRDDNARLAYGKTVKNYPRQCFFYGTVNDDDFLEDPNGNRRYLPVRVRSEFATKNIHDITQTEVDQIWAEALHCYKDGHLAYLDKETEKLAEQHHELHSVKDEREGLVINYLERLLPENWNEMWLNERINWLASEEVGTVQRQYVCTAEVWCECLALPRNEMEPRKTGALNDILKGLKNWKITETQKNYTLYGRQRGFERKKN